MLACCYSKWWGLTVVRRTVVVLDAAVMGALTVTMRCWTVGVRTPAPSGVITRTWVVIWGACSRIWPCAGLRACGPPLTSKPIQSTTNVNGEGGKCHTKNHMPMPRTPRGNFTGAERSVTLHDKTRTWAYLQGGGHDKAALRQLVDNRHGRRPDSIDDELFSD